MGQYFIITYNIYERYYCDDFNWRYKNSWLFDISDKVFYVALFLKYKKNLEKFYLICG